MWQGKSLFFLVAVSVLGSGSPSLAEPVPAQHCKWLYDHSFTLLTTRDLQGIERESNPDDLQLKVNAEVYAIFGPRQGLCEEGAYGIFMERMERYASDALRSNRADRSMRIRAAMSVMQKNARARGLYRGGQREHALPTDAGEPADDGAVDGSDAAGPPAAGYHRDGGPTEGGAATAGDATGSASRDGVRAERTASWLGGDLALRDRRSHATK